MGIQTRSIKKKRPGFILQLGVHIDENSVDSIFCTYIHPFDIETTHEESVIILHLLPMQIELYERGNIYNHQTDLISSSIDVKTSTPRLPSAVAIPTARAPTCRILL